MKNSATIGITTAIMMASFIIISATSMSLIFDNNLDFSVKDYEKIVTDSVDEITSVIQIKEVFGKYYFINDEQNIRKIVILIKPMTSTKIDASKFMIKINNGENVKFISFSNNTDFIDSNSLFEHTIWDFIKDDNYGLIVTLDTDRSIINYNCFNDISDMAYITIYLSDQFLINKGDIVELTLIPSIGLSKSLTFEAPLPITQIVSLL